MIKLFINIKELVQVRPEPISFVAGEEMKILPTIKNAFLLSINGEIAEYGSMDDAPEMMGFEAIDCTGRIVMPSYADSHTHIVYAGNREGEFVDKINGLSYEEIANRGGGILNSAKKLSEISEEQLYLESKERLDEIIEQGTGAVEIKSGYGLSIESELKMLRVINKLKENSNAEIKSTFLGAHAVPTEFKDNKEGYMKMLVDELMPLIAKEKLADFVDVFCETGYFSVADTEMILKAGKKYGLKSKIHVNQFNSIGGVQIGVKYGALSVDHLEVMNSEDIEALKGSDTMPVALPSCSYFLSIPYTPARKIIDSGLPLALASDYNPGSTPSGNMNFVIATACIKMKITP
ncbi:MAG: imidazolonepropionase, partial [Flavobacteriales bacterium]|nr:imidazolonepropionase [Flavobacteriales bacterium]